MSTTEEPKSTNALLEMLINSLAEQAKERAVQRQQNSNWLSSDKKISKNGLSSDIQSGKK